MKDLIDLDIELGTFKYGVYGFKESYPTTTLSLKNSKKNVNRFYPNPFASSESDVGNPYSPSSNPHTGLKSHCSPRNKTKDFESHHIESRYYEKYFELYKSAKTPIKKPYLGY